MPWPEHLGLRWRPASPLKLCTLLAVLCAANAYAQADSVTNTALINLPAGLTDEHPEDNQSSITTPIVNIGTSKSSNRGAGTPVQIGDVITYTTTVTMSAGAVLSQALTLTDTLGPGLTFGAVTAPGLFTCNAANPLVCTLPAGTGAGSYPVSYTATVNVTAVLAVGNSVVPSQGGCTNCTIENPLVSAAVTYGKRATLPLNQTAVAPGDTITYTLTVGVASAPTTDVVTLTDTLGPGLAFVAVTSAGSFTCNAANPLICTLPAGTPIGTYALSYTAQVDATATGTVRNTVVGSGNDNPVCNVVCETDTPLIPPSPQVTFSKAATLPAGRTTVHVGDTITYTLSTSISNASTTATVTLTDTLGTGLTFGAVTNAGNYTCNAASPLVCTLPAGSPPGTHSLSFTAIVNSSAVGSVRNVVVASGGDTPTCVGTCSTDTPFVSPHVTFGKDVTLPAGRTAVLIGDVMTFTLSTAVAAAPTTAVVTLLDTLSSGLTFGSVTNAGAYTCGATAPLQCTLPAGTAIGTYVLTYTATVNASATAAVTNVVVGSGNDGPLCGGNCDTSTPVTLPTVTYSKVAVLPPDHAVVNVGDTITYNLATVVAAAPTRAAVTLTDTLGAGLTFGAVTSAASYSCNAANPLICTLPAGTAVGTYPLGYTATVNAAATTGNVHNAVVGTGADNPTCTGDCTTDTPLVTPAQVTYSKAVTLPSGKTLVAVGDVLTYTLSVTVGATPTTAVVTLTDTLGPGLTFGSVTSAGIFTCNAANPLVCTLPAATAVGTYPLSYTATVNASASGTVRNAVVGSGGDNPTCNGTCTTDTPLTPPQVAYSKTATLPTGKTAVTVGDTITYTLTTTVNAVSTTGVVTLTDTLNAGLTFGSVTNAG
ncbi:MAG TPA: hypothetical protein VKB34_03160, partial [Povalibacter sp.]|nr:hypothetical protein [Povalibacter sp.]